MTPKAGIVNSRPGLMPERIFALYQYSIEETERAEQMFLDAGLLDIVLKPGSLSGLQKVELSGEDAASRLKFAALAHGLRPPAIRRFLDPTRKELQEAQLLYVRVSERHSPRGHPRRGTSYDDSAACAECGAGLRQTSPFRLLKGEIPKRGVTAGIGEDFLFHDSIAEVLAAPALGGIGFLPVLDSRKSDPVAPTDSRTRNASDVRRYSRRDPSPRFGEALYPVWPRRLL